MGSAILGVGSLVLDASSVGGAPWQLFAGAGFIGFAVVMLYRINQLVAGPVKAEVRWDRLQRGMKSLECVIDDETNRAIFNATLSGRVWAVEFATLDEMVVVFRCCVIRGIPERWGRWLPKKDVCKGTIGETWEQFHGAISGRRMEPGDQIDLDQRLFTFWGDGRDIGMKQGYGVFTQFRVGVRAPHRIVAKRISGRPL